MLPLNTDQLKKTYQEATRLLQQGKGDEALSLFNQILKANPKLAEVHFQIGQLMMKALKFDPAVESFRTAAKLKPDNTQIWRGYSEALLRAGTDTDIEAAIELLNSSGLPLQARKEIRNRMNGNVVAPKPNLGNLPKQQLQKALMMVQKGRAKQALPLLNKLISAYPNVGILYGLQGTALRDLGQTDKAMQCLGRSVKIDPNIFDSQLNLGHLMLRSGNPNGAIIHLEYARTLNPKSPPVLLFLSQAYNKIDMSSNELAALDAAIKHDSKFVPALLARARFAEKQNNYVMALELIEKAQKLTDIPADIYLLKSNILSAAGNQDESVKNIKIALSKEPDNAGMMRQLATLLQTGGDFEEAEKTFMKTIDLNPLLGSSYRVFSTSHKFQIDDPLLARMEDVYDGPDITPSDRMQLGFALSKAMEGTKQYDRVFTYLNASNQQMRKEYEYDIAKRRDQIDRTKRIFKELVPSGQIGAGESKYAPVFITGMPRSGTTLVEQILSSHSTITGAGELARFNREALNLLMSPKGDRLIESISLEEFDDLADTYEKYVRTLHPDSIQISDKSIQTYLIMGLVWCAMPKAKIVVVRRDPRDNLLSVYKNVFPDGGHLYSYDLDDLGQYYRMFVEMIDFWREVNPDGFYEIWYEDLISNPEEETRKLIAACDLEWEDACLNFHQNKRKVNTLSVFQVRQPIYKSSVKAWQRYEEDLKPLFKSLGDLADHQR